MNSNQSHVILSIFPNYKGFGYVCLQQPNALIDYGVVTISPFSASKLKERFAKTLEYLKPTILILRDCTHQKGNRSERVVSFLQDVKGLARSKAMPVFEYTREDIKSIFFEHNASTKFEIAKVLSEQFPELRRYLPKPRAFYEHEDYYQVMFDALSLVAAHRYFENEENSIT